MFYFILGEVILVHSDVFVSFQYSIETKFLMHNDINFALSVDIPLFNNSLTVRIFAVGVLQSSG